MGDMARHFRVTLADKDGGSMRVEFSQGSAHKVPPTAEDVLDCLSSDAAGYDNAGSFDDWASDLGFDPDSRKAERIYFEVESEANELKAFLGDEAYEILLYHTERQ